MIGPLKLAPQIIHSANKIGIRDNPLLLQSQKQVLSKGQKPAIFPANKAITQKDWKRSIRQKRKSTNPVRTGFEFVEYLNKNSNATYDDLSLDAGITKARVCQLIALHKRLPSEITDFLMNVDESKILKHFTERRLRPLTLLASDDDKIIKFMEMKEAFAVGNTSKQREAFEALKSRQTG